MKSPSCGDAESSARLSLEGTGRRKAQIASDPVSPVRILTKGTIIVS